MTNDTPIAPSSNGGPAARAVSLVRIAKYTGALFAASLLAAIPFASIAVMMAAMHAHLPAWFVLAQVGAIAAAGTFVFVALGRRQPEHTWQLAGPVIAAGSASTYFVDVAVLDLSGLLAAAATAWMAGLALLGTVVGRRMQRAR